MLKPGANAVYFQSLTVENVRCFAEPQTLKLCDENGNPCQWNVLLGKNGVGKTTLLQCLALMAPEQVSTAHGTQVGTAYHPRGSTKQEESLKRNLRARLAPVRVDSIVSAKLCGSQTYEAEVSRRIIAPEKLQDILSKGNIFTSGGTLAYRPANPVPGELDTMQVYGYGAARHIAPSMMHDDDAGDPTASLFAPNVGLLDANEWLLRTDYFAKLDSNGPYQTQLERVKDALCSLLTCIQAGSRTSSDTSPRNSLAPSSSSPPTARW